MTIDFSLTKEQHDLRDAARDFAQTTLAPLVHDADAAPDPHEAVAKTKPEALPAPRRSRARPGRTVAVLVRYSNSNASVM
jgi:alkylation response protein AidB-like acyl-CoA dehydrogenase